MKKTILFVIVLLFTSACGLCHTTTVPLPDAADAPAVQITADESVLAFLDYQVNEARFNPSVEAPTAVNIMASMTFQNTSAERLEVKFPRFAMDINDVFWSDLASTDFQIGRLQPGAQQTIELQSLLLLARATPEQLAVIEAIVGAERVDLRISGTVLIFPGGEEITVEAEFLLDDVQLPGEWLHGSGE